MKRIKYPKEPVVKIHNWVVSIVTGGHHKYHYCMTAKDVQEIKESLPKGSIINIFRAIHNFKEGFET